MKRTALLLLPVVAVLAGCGDDVNSGEVTDKFYESPYTWFRQDCYSYSSNGLCRVYVTTPVYEEEHYVITLTDCDQPHDAGDPCPSERHRVDPGTYADTELGDRLTLGG